MEQLIGLVIGAVMLVIGLGAGRMAERRHFRSLNEREQSLAGQVVLTDLRTYPGGVAAGSEPRLVTGHACISSDYFKTFIAGLRKIIGGELGTYETLMRRARREAVLRMIEEARREGCDGVCNVRLEGFSIGGATGGKQGGVVCVSVLASGTGYRIAERGVHTPPIVLGLEAAAAT